MNDLLTAENSYRLFTLLLGNLMMDIMNENFEVPILDDLESFLTINDDETF